ncbi:MULTISPECIES: CoA transferase subunit A [unclassified Gordonia (in: high G+C Gram-positive bacteria)]|uniref:CoA transferase subunit A n=1 Tax=unclassified Gordonia (in: high G+C Gram-positive bacteria) TaxID=2657482 RepID=UPI001FFEF2A5|nr:MULTISPECIES: CoA-transferase [unclassified Gordonia (in: high G+C Gram-positive bacteria)]UQE75576.1 acyl CoA--acetate/3-ketoacid CoA transferase subunit alpha [Gordonia sp. PP30]
MATDKTSTLDEVIGELADGMTIGIGGWGGRRKPMALVRALARSSLTGLTIVTYGGADLGLLCAAGKVKRAYYGFVSLDSPPFYDPWFARARTSGAIEAREMDEGMVKCGLEAAAARLPFLPIRAGLGSSVPDFWDGELKTVVSPYPDGDGRTQTLIAMPALTLDAAFVHLDLADVHGNAAYTGIDPYFDDLFFAAADRRYLETDRLVTTEELADAVVPQRLLLNRMNVDRVVHTPNGAHFTFSGSYPRDEAFQRFYVESAGDEEKWAAFRTRFLDVDEETYQAEVTAWNGETR